MAKQINQLGDDELTLTGGAKGRLTDHLVEDNGKFYKMGRKEFASLIQAKAHGLPADPSDHDGRLIVSPDAINLADISQDDAVKLSDRIVAATKRVQDQMRAAEKERALRAAEQLLREAGRLK